MSLPHKTLFRVQILLKANFISLIMLPQIIYISLPERTEDEWMKGGMSIQRK